MSRRVVITVSSLVLLVATAVLVFTWWLYRPLCPLDGSASLGGLQQSVSVEFDDRAVPYIEGRTDDDVYLAQGYVTARDRMFQMDMLRRLAYGRMSEVFGSAWLPNDRLMETIGISGLAYAELGKLSPDAKGALESYARGVNDYLAEYARRLPLEFSMLGYTPATWSAQDSLAILKFEAYETDESWRLDDFRQRVTNRVGAQRASQLFNDNLTSFGFTTTKTGNQADGTTGNTSWRARGSGLRTACGAQAFDARTGSLLNHLALEADRTKARQTSGACMGSTTWAVPASATDTHSAMLACNKDGLLTYPCKWYLCSLESPSLHVAGASLPGVPSIIVGRNEAIAFGSSALKADVQDIFLEKFKSQFDTAYQTANGWVEASEDTKLIPVRFAADVEHKVVTTQHGPLLMRNSNMAVSLDWTGFNTDHPSYQALYEMNYAADAGQFVRALSKYSDPPMMFVFADRQGNIGCQAAGLIPVRAGGAQGTALNTGWQTAGQWLSYLPFDKLPHALIAASSVPALPLVAANQALASDPSTNALPICPPDVMLGHQFDPPYRANRLLALLSVRKNPVSLADMVALSGDEYSALAPLVAQTLKNALDSQHVIDRNSMQAVELLSRWDGQLQPISNEAGIYESFLQTTARRLTEPLIGRSLATEYLKRYPQWVVLAQSVIQNQPAHWLPPESRTFSTFVSTTLAQSLKALRITFDTSNISQWNWGDIHQVIFTPIAREVPPSIAALSNLPAVASGGAPECISSFNVALDAAATNYQSTAGPQERLLVDMADHDKFYQSISSGESGCFLSPHHADQLKSWAAADFMPIAFSSEQVMRQSKHRLALEPE